MRAVLIPVKDLFSAKQRLAGMLSQGERTELAAAMMEDVFAAVAEARGFEQVFVVSSYEPALERARSFGWAVLREATQNSESDSVDRASRECAGRGVTALLRLPIDIPLVQPGDVETIFAAAGAGPGCVLIPSRDGTGTNALLRIPPALFPSHFGENSFSKHRAEAEKQGAAVRVLRNARIELDVDDAGDLQELIARADASTATGRWLRRAGKRMFEGFKVGMFEG